ncbi:PREDICTED: calcium-binding protein PBP1-like [Tarenaya hassleriana]|uniref:calcium-binding protein PBP1-like n=1 Tax=Tarenaya hassleriana TaxID=28532 RepID=UPI00053C4FD7|nr:PREDICTED: calcium-binding protein PBP1-like [Tarenaya hassleriana]
MVVPSRKSRNFPPLYTIIDINPTNPSLQNLQFLSISTTSTQSFDSSALMASPKSSTRPTQQNPEANFQDFLPTMASKLGGEALISELCKGFELLKDGEKGVITFESLRRNAAAVLGLGDLTDDDVRCMIGEGDFDRDGALNQMEFCVLMFRLSPELMEASRSFVAEAIEDEYVSFTRRR